MENYDRAKELKERERVLLTPVGHERDAINAALDLASRRETGGLWTTLVQKVNASPELWAAVEEELREKLRMTP